MMEVVSGGKGYTPVVDVKIGNIGATQILVVKGLYPKDIVLVCLTET
jgi:hypothetical protein